MTAEQFAFWMQGFAELSGDAPPTAEQWKSIREHLARVTPPVGLPRHPTDPNVVLLPNTLDFQHAGSPLPPRHTVTCSAP